MVKRKSACRLRTKLLELIQCKRMVWYMADRLFGPFVLDERLTGKRYLRFLGVHLPEILNDRPLNVRQRIK